MALANDSPYYMTPAEIRRMADDLSVLPAWYAGGMSVRTDAATRVQMMVKVPDIKVVEVLLQQSAGAFPLPEVRWTDSWCDGDVWPWGWDRALKHRLLKAGVRSACLPSDEWLDAYRVLSGRQQCVGILQSFAGFSWACGRAQVCRSLPEVIEMLSTLGEGILKAPWSGSGRGLVRVSPETWTASVEGWVQRVLRTQDEIMLEPLYDKVCDFAMEFLSDGNGRVDFAGYSFFDTDSHGNYKANWLAPDEAIEQRLAGWIAVEVLHEVRRQMTERLSTLLGKVYRGYFGVDMMICRVEGEFRVHPCVEINLRMNMGVVARLVSDRYVAPLSRGWYVVEHYAQDGEALSAHHRLYEEHPLHLSTDGKISSGYFSLTPVRESTRYQAYLLVE